jgi:DNA-binding transcriptional MerR regulator
MRPIDIARKLNISTSALRHYESWGIVPQPSRGTNGYRLYTEEHLAYFECIRAMNASFGMQLTKDVMKLLQINQMDEALWLVNGAQADLHQEKAVVERTIRVLDNDELENIPIRNKRKWMTIGEVAKEANTPASTIRHWELRGLIAVQRDPESGYRRFNQAAVRQILIIRILQSGIYSLDVIKQVIKELDDNNLEQARLIARRSLHYLNDISRGRIRATYKLYLLCNLLKVLD